MYRKFSQAVPDLYLCKFFQSAVCSGPSVVEVQVRGRQLEVRWNGESFSAEELAQVKDYLQQGGAMPERRAARHLASGLLFLSTRPDIWFRLECGTTGLDWRAHQAVLNEAGSSGSTVLRVTRRGWLPVGGLARLLASFDVKAPLISWLWPELLQFHCRLGHHPGEVRLNGRMVPTTAAGNLASRICVSAGEACVGLDISEPPPLLSWEGGPAAPSGGKVACRQFINLNHNFAQAAYFTIQPSYVPDELTLVSDGIPVYFSRNWLGQVGIVMVVAHSDLPTDASTLSLIEGPELKAAIKQARHDAEAFLLDLETNLGPNEDPNSLDGQLAAALRSWRSLPR